MKKVILVAAMILAGCAAGPRNVEELKATGTVETFTINQEYQQAYRNMKQGFDQCSGQAGLWQLGSTLDSDLYTDIGEGRLVVNMKPQFGQPQPIRLIIIKSVDDQRSIMTVYQASRFAGDVKSTYQRLAAGESQCR